MSLEGGTFVSDLVQTNPVQTDKKKQGDDHLRLIKTVLRNTFPNGDRADYFDRATSQAASGNIVAADMRKLFAIDAAAAARSWALPTLAAGNDGWFVRVRKTDSSANTVTVTGTINGATNYVLTRQYEEVVVQWSGTAWYATKLTPTIGTGELEALAVTTAKIADLAVTTAKIADINVTSGKLADNSVATAKIVDAAVTNAKLAGVRMTMQVLTAGTAATYTTPANCRSILAIFVGGGGGGGAVFTNNGAAGTATTFNSVDANPGNGGGANAGAAGLGGTGGAGTATLRLPGSAGGQAPSGVDNTPGGTGAPGIFGTGAGRAGNFGAGGNGQANTGAGGGGGSLGANDNQGSAGGAGELVFLLIQSPAATYTYTVGTGGNGGAAGSAAGGNGGSGIIIVLEFY